MLLLHLLEITIRAAQSLFEAHFRLPAERAPRAPIGEHGLIDIAGARLLAGDGNLMPRCLLEDGDELLEARLRLRREVVGTVDLLRLERSVNADTL